MQSASRVNKSITSITPLNLSHKLSFFLGFLLLLMPVIATAQDTTSQTRGLKVKDYQSEDLDWYEDRYAIIVGINDYTDSDIGDLDYATNDAKAIRDLLINKFDYKEENVTLLLNEEATKQRIESALSGYQDIKQNSKVLFYFAGHGETITKPVGSGEMGVLLTHDSNKDNMWPTGIPMNSLSTLSGLIGSKHQLFLVDACYGGLSTYSTRGLSKKSERRLSSVLAANSKQIITAGRKDEVVQEKSIWGHSAFAKAILSGLKKELADGNNDQLITASELSNHLKSKVTALTEGKQNPVYERFTAEQGDFVFLLEDPGELSKGSKKAQKGKFSSVTINSQPEDAKVFVDDKIQGTTPLSLQLPYDSAKIRFQKEGYEQVVKHLDISQATYELNPQLQETQAQVRITSNVDGAMVYVDETHVGSTPYQGKVRTGVVKIRVKKPEYKTVVEHFRVQQPRDSLNVKMVRNMTDVQIASNVNGGEILLNGEKIGTTPYNGEVEIGNKMLTIRKDDYHTYEQLKTINHEQDSIYATLDPKKVITIKSNPDSADVYVNGRHRGKTPVELEDLNMDSYEVRVEKDNYPTVKKTFNLNKQPQYNKEFDLKGRVGSVNLIGFRGSANVSIEGRDFQTSLDSVPSVKKYLPEGKYQVTVNKRGFRKYSKTLNLSSSGESINVGRVLSPKAKSFAILRSALVSGWGHTYMDRHKQAQFYFLTGMSTGIYTLTRLMKLERDISISERSKTKKQLTLGALAYFGIKGLELIDLFVTPSPKEIFKKGKVDFQVDNNSIGMRVNF